MQTSSKPSSGRDARESRSKVVRLQERGSDSIATHRGVEGSRLRRFPGIVARAEQRRRTESPYSGIALFHYRPTIHVRVIQDERQVLGALLALRCIARKFEFKTVSNRATGSVPVYTELLWNRTRNKSSSMSS